MPVKKLQLFAQIVGFVTIIILSVAGLMAIARTVYPAQAQEAPDTLSNVANVINYQGMLRKPDGSPVGTTEDSDLNMTFRLYDSATGGTKLHEETAQDVVVREGLFTVLLGDAQGNPFPADLFKQPLYVGIQVGDDAEMLPRQRIAPVPYAVQLTDGVYVDGSGNVGIGNKDPNVRLDVKGDAAVSGNADVGKDLTVGGNTNVGGNADVGKNLTVSGNTEVKGDLTVNGFHGFGLGSPILKRDQTTVAIPDDCTSGNVFLYQETATSDGFVTAWGEAVAGSPSYQSRWNMYGLLNNEIVATFSVNHDFGQSYAYDRTDSFTMPVARDATWKIMWNCNIGHNAPNDKYHVFWTPLGQP